MAEMFLVYPMHFTITNAQHSPARSLTALLRAADAQGKVNNIRVNYHYESFFVRKEDKGGGGKDW